VNLYPVRAVFARPGLCSIAGPAHQHKIIDNDVTYLITSDFVRNAVVNLQIAWFVGGGANSAFAAVSRSQCIFEVLWPRRSPAHPAGADLRRVTKSVRGNRSAVCPGDLERFQRNALLTNISRSPWCVIVPVFSAQLLGSNEPVGEDTINDCLCPFGSNRPQLLEEFWGQLLRW
jgi:hypothetical protein